MQISPSSLQGPRKMETELRQHLVLQWRCQMCPGAEPCWSTSRVLVGDGEATQVSLVDRGPFPSPTLGCLQSLFPSSFPPWMQMALLWSCALGLSKTSHVLNREQGDKETSQASPGPVATGQELLHHPSWDGEDGASHSHGHPLCSLSPATYETIHSHPLGLPTDLPTIRTTENSKGVPLKAKPNSRLH